MNAAREPVRQQTSGDAPVGRWPRLLRRGPMEALATVIIAAGVLMLLQPFSMGLYTKSFVTTLVGTVMFLIVSKFPE